MRELMFLLKKGKFDIDSDESSTVRKLMMRFFGSSSSTKEILESTFAHLSERGFPVKQEQSVCTTFALDVHNGVLLRKSVGDDAALSKKVPHGQIYLGRTA